MIEKHIHQTAPSYEELPQDYKDNIEKIKNLNPEWKYHFYDDAAVENFIKSNFDGRIFRLFSKIDERYGAARADLFRYLVVFRYGGLYLDIKSTLLTPLDLILVDSDTFITSHWPEILDGVDISAWGKHEDLISHEFQNWFIFSDSSNEILQKVIDKVLDNIENYNATRDGVGRRGVISLTGPVAYSQVLEKKENIAKVKIISNEKLGFVYSIYGINDSKHIRLQKEHYTKLFIPIIKTNLMKTVYLYWRFRIKNFQTRLIRKFNQIFMPFIDRLSAKSQPS